MKTNEVTFERDGSGWFGPGDIGIISWNGNVPSDVHKKLFNVDPKTRKFFPSETGRRVNIRQGRNLGSVALAYSWSPENESIMRSLI